MKTQRMASLKTVEAFRQYVASLGIDLEAEDHIILGDASPLSQPIQIDQKTVGNRWVIHPMEGWDGTKTGGATEPMKRRWRRFGESGAKLIWGGEAMAVEDSGRANPNQLVIKKENEKDLASLRQVLLESHRERFGSIDDLLVGFQLTHSGRFARPKDKMTPAPRVAYRHPILDRRFHVDSDACVLSDDEVKRLIDLFVKSSKIAWNVGAEFVDIKHCHGYLLHEFLSAVTRPGPFGGSFENRTRILREIVAGIRSEVPGLRIGVRLSGFDFVPYRPDPEKSHGNRLGPGIPEDTSAALPYRYGFGTDPDDPTQYRLEEPSKFLELLRSLDIQLVNISAGSPYYNPHIQRPALYPPSDGYQPCEDPLVGVARQIKVVKDLKASFPDLILVGSAYSYLQEYLPHVAQHYVRGGHVDMVGLGRMVLSYPHLPIDVLTAGKLNRKLLCRTFSDCTTAPRKGLPSGCYPLDTYYKSSEDGEKLRAIKSARVATAQSGQSGQSASTPGESSDES